MPWTKVTPASHSYNTLTSATAMWGTRAATSAITSWTLWGSNNLPPHDAPSQVSEIGGRIMFVWTVRSEPSPSRLAGSQNAFLDDPWLVASDTPVNITSGSAL